MRSLAEIYAEGERIERILEIAGFRIVSHVDMPPNEVHLVELGRCVGKIVMEPEGQIAPTIYPSLGRDRGL